MRKNVNQLWLWLLAKQTLEPISLSFFFFSYLPWGTLIKFFGSRPPRALISGPGEKKKKNKKKNNSVLLFLPNFGSAEAASRNSRPLFHFHTDVSRMWLKWSLALFVFFSLSSSPSPRRPNSRYRQWKPTGNDVILWEWEIGLHVWVQPVSCNFEHPWTQRCSVFKRAVSFSTHPRGTHASTPPPPPSVQLHRGPINWLAESVLWTVEARPIFFHTASTCRSVLWASCSDSSSKIGCWKLHEMGHTGIHVYFEGFVFVFARAYRSARWTRTRNREINNYALMLVIMELLKKEAFSWKTRSVLSHKNFCLFVLYFQY